MIDCGTDVKAFHDQKVTLPGSEQEEMRKRRNTNRDRLKRNLEKADKPYAVRTCVPGKLSNENDASGREQ